MDEEGGMDSIYSEYYSATKKRGIMPFATSQTEKDKYHTISLTCGIGSMTQANVSTKQKDSGREWKCGCHVGGGLREGRAGSLGLADAQYCIENR